MERIVTNVLKGALVSIIALYSLNSAAQLFAATLRSAEEVAKVVELRSVSFKNGEVSGQLINKTGHTLRDVELQIRFNWRWKNEYKPQADTAGDTIIYKVEQEIPPGGIGSFNYKHAAPSRDDGFYETTVSVAGYTEVIR